MAYSYFLLRLGTVFVTHSIMLSLSLTLTRNPIFFGFNRSAHKFKKKMLDGY